MTSCPQHAFGSCPGSTCDRNCSERMFLTAQDMVREKMESMDFWFTLGMVAVLLSVISGGLVAGKIAMERQEHAYKMEARI